LGLLGLNGMLYWEHFTGKGQTRGKAQDLTKRFDEEEAEIERLRQKLSTVNIEGLNRRTRFVNLEIDRRRFAWSRLFDELAVAQPGAVRLLSMSPKFPDSKKSSRSGGRPEANEITIELEGVAKSGEAILEFIDGLFLHASFRDPDLSQESLRDDGTSRFFLSVLYLPKVGDDTASAAPQGGKVVEASNESESENAV
jgi:Tfp pilus assembly protein PilN